MVELLQLPLPYTHQGDGLAGRDHEGEVTEVWEEVRAGE